MFTHIIFISDLDNTLMTLGLKVRTISLKIYMNLIIDSIAFKLIGTLVFSIKYVILMIFK